MNTQMRFLLISSYPDTIIKFRGELIKNINSYGLQVFIASPDLALVPQIVQQLEDDKVKTIEIPLSRTGLNPIKDLFLFYRLLKIMLLIKPQFVLGYNIKPVIYGAIAAKISGVPNVYSLVAGVGYFFYEEKNLSILKKIVHPLYALSMRCSTKVFFQNADDEKLFRERKILPVNTPSIVVNGSGVDLDFYSPAPFPSSPFTFLLIARLLSAKGVRIYVEASYVLRSRYPDVNFNLVGWYDIDNPDAIKPSEVNKWVEDGVINFYGKLNDVRNAIASCHVYVLPSYREGVPRTVLEAMAMGRPIITTDAPGCRETVIDNLNGFLVPVRSVEGLVVAMENFIKAPSLIYSMCRFSRKIAEEKFDVHKVNDLMLNEMGLAVKT